MSRRGRQISVSQHLQYNLNSEFLRQEGEIEVQCHLQGLDSNCMTGEFTQSLWDLLSSSA